MVIVNIFLSVALLMATADVYACSETSVSANIQENPSYHANKIQFRGIYADESSVGIYNPERGLRLEIAVDIKRGCDVWNHNLSGITDHLIAETQQYLSDSISLVQSYFYLHGYIGQDLDDQAFGTMDIYFKQLRELGQKAVLRFAYETGWGADGPTLDNLLRHTRQLKPFLEKNKDVIQVVQAGMIGAWGEWHSSKHGLEGSDESKRTILEHIMDMTPKDRYLQIRVPSTKNLIPKNSPVYQRLSFHDDMIIIDPHPWDGNMHEGTDFFAQIVKESPYSPVDGELPWGTWSVNQDPDTPEAGWIIDGVRTARQLFLEHFTSLSAIHNYKEKRGDGNGLFSMMHWKETPITLDYLEKHHMPISSCYFEKKDGTRVERNAFDYIRDHLGYRLELQQLVFGNQIKKNADVSLELTLMNRGFSTLFNEHPVYFVLIDQQGEVYEFKTDADVNKFQPYDPGDKMCETLIHSIRGTVRLSSLPMGKYKLGLWIPDGDERLKYKERYAIRCANGDVKWWTSSDKKYGINILSEFKVK